MIKNTTPRTKKINFMFLLGKKETFLNAAEPHLIQTILPPKDLSETNDALPQLRQTLFVFI